MFQWFSRPTHMPLVADGDDFDDKSFDSSSESQYPPARHPARPWQIATIVLVILSLSLSAYIFTHLPPSCTDTSSFLPTDLLDARRAIEYEPRTYTGALIYDPGSKLIERLKDGDVEYVGPPSQELDDNWEALVKRKITKSFFLRDGYSLLCVKVSACLSLARKWRLRPPWSEHG